MKYVIASLVAGLVLYAFAVVAGGAATWSPPSFGHAAGLADARATDEEARGQYLDARLAEAVHRATAKERTALQVISGELSLLEAASCFQALDRGVPAMRRGRMEEVLDYPNASAGERYCRRVISYIRQHFDEDPSIPMLIARLEKELEDRLRRVGTIRLPDVPLQ